jgi:hypothetical protein
MTLRLVLSILAVLLGGGLAWAQAPLSTPPRGPGLQGPPGALPPAPVPAKKGECALLPGGKAPVAAIAELPTPLSPRSLDLIYFGKRLADLTPADFQRIGELSKRCGPGEGYLKPDKLELLREVIREAQKAREVTIGWGKQKMVEVGGIPVGRQRLVRLNDLWIELEAHEGEMIREDVDSFAAWIAREQQAIYDAAPRWRPHRPVIAAMPLPPPPGAATFMTSADTPILSVGRGRRPGGEED